MSTSAQIQYVYNQKLWNGATEEKPWLFGVWKVAGFAAIHGQAGLRFEVYPISFLRLSLQKALTSRFYEVQTLDCQFVECGGWVDRTSMRADLALAYRDWFLVPSLERVILGPVESGKNFASEEDNLVADRSGDQLLKWQVAFGFKEGPRKFILLHQENQMSKSTDHSQASYFIYSADWSHDWSYFAGMGSFGSTHAKDSLSLVAGFKWTHGESVSLF